jgi:hypothetical protein
MKIFHRFIRSFIFCSLFIVSCSGSDQEKVQIMDIPFEEGMEGKNVPWIGTPHDLVEKMLEIAKITPQDFLIDLGSGDGRLVIKAAQMGTRALGVEYNPDLVQQSKINAEKVGVADITQFVEADLFEFDFSRASVISMFLLPEINMKLRPKLLNLRPGTRIVSNTFTMQEWKYDDLVKSEDETNRWNTAYLWIVPEKVAGTWDFSLGGKLIFKQEYQMLTGSVLDGNKSLPITDGRLRGNEITFYVGSTIYNGLVIGDKMEGNITSDGEVKKWMATSQNKTN